MKPVYSIALSIHQYQALFQLLLESKFYVFIRGHNVFPITVDLAGKNFKESNLIFGHIK